VTLTTGNLAIGFGFGLVILLSRAALARVSGTASPRSAPRTAG
jgi:hypothetical protein